MTSALAPYSSNGVARELDQRLGSGRSPLIPPMVLLGLSSLALLARMKSHPTLEGIAVAEPSIAHQALAPVANELAQTYYELRRIIENRSLVGDPGHAAFGAYLDELGDQEMGVPRLVEVPAQYVVEFRGTPGAQVPEVTRVLAGQLSFRLLVPAEIGGDGTGGALVECTTPGTVGNVAAGAINRIDGPPLPGISGVTNPSGVPLVAGSDVEDDDEYRTRLLRYRRDPPNGCNAAQFRLWAERVPGVGRAECIRPLEPIGPQGQQPPPPGTVWVFVTGPELIHVYDNGLMAPQSVVDAVQQYIAPRLPSINVFPYGTVGTLPDDGADHAITVSLPISRMEIAGIWQMRPALAISFPNGGPPPPGTNVVSVTAFNVTDNEVMGGRPNNQAPGVGTRTFTAHMLDARAPDFPAAAPAIDFYWDGGITKTLELRIERTAAQAALGNGTVNLEGVWLTSAFSDPTHEGLAPVADRVEVFAAKPVYIDVSVTVEPKPAWTMGAVQEWVEDALRDYLRSIVFAGAAPPVGGLPNRRANDVLFGMIGSVLYGGCRQGEGPLLYYNPASLRLNGGTGDVEVWTGDIAVLGQVSLTRV